MTTGANVYWNKQSSLNDVMGILQAVRRVLSNVHTSLPVEVVNCTNSGGVSAIGTVTLKILMNQVDSFGNTVAPGATLYNVPYSRLQGGTNAVINDPVAGDMGMASFCEKDISNIMATYGAANPNSNRRNSISDAIFVCYVGNTVPTQYVQFLPSNGGINVVSPNGVNLEVGGSGAASFQMTPTLIQCMVGSIGFTIGSGGINFIGPVTGTETATFDEEGTFNGGHTVSDHTHQVHGVQTGSSTVTSVTPTG